MDQTSLLVPRLTIILLVPIELGIVAWYFLYWDLFPKVLNSTPPAMVDLSCHWHWHPLVADLCLQIDRLCH